MRKQRMIRSCVASFVFGILTLWLCSNQALAADEVNKGWKKVIDYGQTGYSETGSAWRTYPSFGHNGTYRYLSHYDRGRKRVGTATWKLVIPASGTYKVSVSIRHTENRTPDADYYVTNSKDGENHYTVDQRGHAGLYKWKTFGEFHYTKGQKVRVHLDGTDDNHSDCADAASWELVKLDPAPRWAVLKPKGGEEWFTGRTYTIRWRKESSGNGDKAYIAMCTKNKQGEKCKLVADGVKNTGSYRWKIPEDFVPSSRYYAKIYDNKDHIDRGEKFTLTHTPKGKWKISYRWTGNPLAKTRWKVYVDKTVKETKGGDKGTWEKTGHKKVTFQFDSGCKAVYSGRLKTGDRMTGTMKCTTGDDTGRWKATRYSIH